MCRFTFIPFTRGWWARFSQLYHEASLVNLLECLLYHSSAVEALGDSIVDLVDVCARRLGGLVARGARLQRRDRLRRRAQRKAAKASAAAAGGAAAAARDEEEQEDEEEEEGDVRSADQMRTEAARPDAVAKSLRRRGRAIRLRVGVTCVGIVRYLAEHCTSLPLAGVVRMVETHDLILALVPLIENPPWVRKARILPPGEAAGSSSASAGQQWEKLVDLQWKLVPPADLLKLTQPEAQAWLGLHMLLSHDEFRKRWPMHSYRKSTLMRVRRYLNPVLVDQLPPLADLQRFLDQSSVQDAPAATADGLGRKVLLEASAELTDALLGAATGNTAIRTRAAAIIRHEASSEAGDAVATASEDDKHRALWTAIGEASTASAFRVADRDSSALKAIAGLYEAEAFEGLAQAASTDPASAAAAAPLSSEDEDAVIAAAEARLQSQAADSVDSVPSRTAPAPAPAAVPAPAPAAQPKRMLIEVVDEMD